METYTTHSYEETLALAAEFAKRLNTGDLIFLEGELGAGKTAFCTGLARALGCVDTPSSPTYTIVNLYRGVQPLAHFDMYRITSEEDLETAGYFDYLDAGAIVAAEWAGNIARFSPPPRFTITITQNDINTRTLTIKEHTC